MEVWTVYDLERMTSGKIRIRGVVEKSVLRGKAGATNVKRRMRIGVEPIESVHNAPKKTDAHRKN